jgi:hypothetical protein
VPSNIRVINETDVILWEKIDPMAAANCLKTVGSTGVTTLDTGSAIVINTDGTVTLSATLSRQRQGDQVPRHSQLVRRAGGGETSSPAPTSEVTACTATATSTSSGPRTGTSYA